MNTHLALVLEHLKQGKTLSSVEAITLFNCYRLSAVIKRLRNLGYNIATHNESNLNGRGIHARYELRKVCP